MARVTPRRRALATVPVGMILLGWGLDGAAANRAFVDSGEVMQAIVADIAAARGGLPPDRVLVVADLPECWGPDREIPMLGWGARCTLVAMGAREPLLLVRTRAYVTSTDLPLVSPEEWASLRAQHPGAVLQFVPRARRLVHAH
jgi:hypothetical protein